MLKAILHLRHNTTQEHYSNTQPTHKLWISDSYAFIRGADSEAVLVQKFVVRSWILFELNQDLLEIQPANF